MLKSAFLGFLTCWRILFLFLQGCPGEIFVSHPPQISVNLGKPTIIKRAVLGMLLPQFMAAQLIIGIALSGFETCAVGEKYETLVLFLILLTNKKFFCANSLCVKVLRVKNMASKFSNFLMPKLFGTWISGAFKFFYAFSKAGHFCEIKNPFWIIGRDTFFTKSEFRCGCVMGLNREASLFLRGPS